MTNAFNLLDNMDGLAATLAAIACAFFAVDAYTVHPSHLVALLSLGICFACIGFLPYNLRLNRPAAVFMGDSGAQVLGFALAALGLASSWTVAGSTVATLLLPVLVLAVPILDTTLVTVVRLLEGRPVTRGGRDHTSHRLVYQGLSDKRAVVLLGVVSAALGLTSLGYKVLDDTRVTLAGVLITFAFLLQFGSYLADINRAPVESDTTSFLRSLFVHRRRLVEVVVDFALIAASFTVAYIIRDRREGHHLGPPPLQRRPAGRPRRALRVLRRLRPVPRRVAIRGRPRRGEHLRRRRPLGVRRVRLPRRDGRLARVPARRLRDRRAHLRAADRRPPASGSAASRMRSARSSAAARRTAR